MAGTLQLLTLLLNCFIILVAAIHSGVYVDNGKDQTVVHHELSHRERRHFELEFLDLLGVQKPPRVTRSIPVRSSGHKFLLDLYKSQLDSGTRSTRSGFDISEQDLSVIQESDAILSLKNLYRSENETSAIQQKLWFDVGTISPAVERIIKAELRVFQSSLGTAPADKLYSVTVHQIVRSSDEEELQLVGTVNTSVAFEGWHSFNITGPLAQWKLTGQNYGLYIQAYEFGFPDTPVSLAELGISQVKSQVDLDDEADPFMIVFMHGDSRRSPRVRRQTRHRKRKTENSETPNINPLTDPIGHSWSQSPRSCQIQSLFVNFSDLEWQDWIIAPVGYSAFYCSGECNFPLNAHMNATNHAIVQTLVNLINPLRVPRPCCAPTKLSSISVLYFVDDNNVILKKYKNMVVKSCGCH
ncbi:glass bottom boat [Nesidiocoris tenuis]|uniref:Glass bottom boat n=1 Tax=Nesidiocoris tenuis TaxID=355587 RepID=A0ABN7A9Q0_9HEMI|nr:glass bottom boat [Nesidiocoris tenuis]